MNTIEKESLDKTGLRSDVITLYQGGQYHLYRFKKYTDVRLVFAPEQDIAFFGGDPDNFEYPRYDLDICFFRVYENGKPAKVPHYLKWSTAASEGRRAGVRLGPSGPHRPAEHGGPPGVHPRPGVAADAQPAAPLRGAAEHLQPAEQGERPPGPGRPVRRAEQPQGPAGRAGRPAGPGRHAAASGPTRPPCARPWPATRGSRKTVRRRLGRRVEAALRSRERSTTTCELLEHRPGLPQRAVQHRPHAWSAWPRSRASPTPSGSASTASRTSTRSSSSSSPRRRSTTTWRTLKLADSLSMFMEVAGADDPLVQKVLAGKSPQERAAELVARHQAPRGRRSARSWPKGACKAIEASDDPMIRLARLVDGPARQVRKTYEEKVEEPLRQAYAKIANARFALFGTRRLPGRHLHAAPGLRHGQGLRPSRARQSRRGPRSPGPTSAPKSTTTSIRSSCRRCG